MTQDPIVQLPDGKLECTACENQYEPSDRDRTAIGAAAEGLPEQDPILQFFRYEHLRPELKQVSQPFCDLARQIVETLPRNPERTVALRKLLEAKDAAVRAQLYERDD